MLWQGTSLNWTKPQTSFWVGRLDFFGENDSRISIFMYTDDNGDLYFSSLNKKIVMMTVPKDEWCNVRFELHSQSLLLYLNNELQQELSVYDIWPNYTGLIGNITSFKIENRCYLTDYLYKLDNTYISAMTE